MKDPVALSKSIRAKKKALKDPMDKQDMDLIEQNSETKELNLDHNEPKEMDEEPSSNKADAMEDNHKGEHQEPSDAGIDELIAKRKARLKGKMK